MNRALTVSSCVELHSLNTTQFLLNIVLKIFLDSFFFFFICTQSRIIITLRDTFQVQNISLRFCYNLEALSPGNTRQAHISQQQICYCSLKGSYLTSGAAWSLSSSIRSSGCIGFDVGRSGLWRQTVSLVGGGLCTGKHVEPILGNSLVRLEAHHLVPGKVYKRNLSM